MTPIDEEGMWTMNPPLEVKDLAGHVSPIHVVE